MKRAARLALLPLAVWTLALVVVPLVYVFALSLLTQGEAFGATGPLTLSNYARAFSGANAEIYLSSLTVALSTTLITLLIGYPFALCMARAKKKWRPLLMLLVVIPFWTSSLMRTYGWMILMRKKGLINAFLLWLGVIDQPLTLLYTRGAVVFGMAYAFLPFMILPLYSAIERLDPTVQDASRDLGAGPIRAFFTVKLPLTLPGILSGCVLVFVPSAGMYFISDLLGGTGMLLGNLIQNQLTGARNWPYGASLSMLLTALTFVSMQIYRKVTGGAGLEVF